jgi:hypothetical protein
MQSKLDKFKKMTVYIPIDEQKKVLELMATGEQSNLKQLNG